MKLKTALLLLLCGSAFAAKPLKMDFCAGPLCFFNLGTPIVQGYEHVSGVIGYSGAARITTLILHIEAFDKQGIKLGESLGSVGPIAAGEYSRFSVPLTIDRYACRWQITAITARAVKADGEEVSGRESIDTPRVATGRYCRK
jgi:hypothetical protein